MTAPLADDVDHTLLAVIHVGVVSLESSFLNDVVILQRYTGGIKTSTVLCFKVSSRQPELKISNFTMPVSPSPIHSSSTLYLQPSNRCVGRRNQQTQV